MTKTFLLRVSKGSLNASGPNNKSAQNYTNQGLDDVLISFPSVGGKQQVDDMIVEMILASKVFIWSKYIVIKG